MATLLFFYIKDVGIVSEKGQKLLLPVPTPVYMYPILSFQHFVVNVEFCIYCCFPVFFCSTLSSILAIKMTKYRLSYILFPWVALLQWLLFVIIILWPTVTNLQYRWSSSSMQTYFCPVSFFNNNPNYYCTILRHMLLQLKTSKWNSNIVHEISSNKRLSIEWQLPWLIL